MTEVGNWPWLLIVPEDLYKAIFEAAHDAPTAGLLGCSRTLARICERCYLSSIPKFVRHYTRTCRERQVPTSKDAVHTYMCGRPAVLQYTAGLLQPIAPPVAPF